jgi:FkbM family methyltransferase
MRSEIPIIQCPLDCLACFSEVFSGQYDHPALRKVLQQDAIYSPRILDIGANVGAFAIWAKDQWPHSVVSCYEPQESLFQPLSNNLSHLIGCEIFPVAIASAKVLPFYSGNTTRLCGSMMKMPRASFSNFEVPCLDARLLNASDIVKLDCEGSEGYICENLQFTPAYIAIEYHSEELRMRCEKALDGKMQMVECTQTAPGLGMIKFIRIRK